MKIIVIGDTCTDLFRYGEVSRLAPEAPVPIIKPEFEEKNLGMAGNVVRNLESLGSKVDFVSNKNEIVKIRYVCSKYNHLLLRVDENDQCEQLTDDVLDAIKWGNYDAVVISDYCKGFLTSDQIKKISLKHPLTFLDSKRMFGNWVYDIKFIKINYSEYEKNLDVINSDENIKSKIIVTRGKYGCDYLGKNYPTQEVPIKDVSGAGDTFLAALVYNYVLTNNIEKAINFAQLCTLEVIQKRGVSVIEKKI
jgi:bifunctional ADP-heptose synthase (sugar kinase/adenylyltransferase)